LAGICNILTLTGKPFSALTHAKKAHRYAEHMGDTYGQAWSLFLQAECHAILANYRHDQFLLRKSRDMLTACGLQQSALDLMILNHQAHIHLVKSEYLESRKLNVAIASSCRPCSYSAILANLNIAFIDIATGANSKIICQNVDLCRFRVKEAFYGCPARYCCLIADYSAAELYLRDGAHNTANAMFQKCFASALDIRELALLCTEKVGDLSTGMNDISTTLQWAGVFICLALKSHDKRQTMQAFRCLGQIFSAQGDDKTALSLFKVALDGFTVMDVHRWRADCMVRIADILKDCGEVMKAVELWKTARPLFERSSQMKDITRIDAKLAEVDSVVLAEYEGQFHQLSELHVSTPEETIIAEDEE
jgi:hypothetical protein